MIDYYFSVRVEFYVPVGRERPVECRRREAIKEPVTFRITVLSIHYSLDYL
jgi:hypothetical protein